MRTGAEKSAERSDSVVVTRVSSRMAPAPAGGKGGTEGSSRTTFAVGKITRRRSLVRSVELRETVRDAVRDIVGGTETVH